MLLLSSVAAFSFELSYVGIDIRNATNNRKLNGTMTWNTHIYASSPVCSGIPTNTHTSIIRARNGSFVVNFNYTATDSSFFIKGGLVDQNYSCFRYTADAQSQLSNDTNNLGGVAASLYATQSYVTSRGYIGAMNTSQFLNNNTVKVSWLNSVCTLITGGSGLCDGNDNTGSDTDDQTLSYVEGTNILTISEGNSINLSELDDIDTDTNDRHSHNTTQFTDNSTIRVGWLNGLFYSVSNPSAYISDGNTLWDNTYGFITKTRYNSTQMTNSSGNVTLKTSYLNTFVQAVAVGGEVSGTVGSITLGNDALDDQYYDSESDLTTLLNDNYQASNTNKVKFNGTQMTNATGNLTIKTGWLDNIFVGQSEYPNLDTDSTNDFSGAYKDLTGRPYPSNTSQINENRTIKISWLTSVCSTITGGSGLCDGIDNTGSGISQVKHNGTQMGNSTGNLTIKVGWLNGLFYSVSNPSAYISDGNTLWDNSYGFITKTRYNGTQFTNSSGNLTLKLSYLDGRYYLVSNPSGYISSYINDRHSHNTTQFTDNSTIKVGWLNGLFYSVSNPSAYISDGNTLWDNSYGFITKTRYNSTQMTNSSGNVTLKTGYLNTFVQAVAVGGEVSGTVGSITLGNDALDDQYYDSESDLTTLLNDNYQAQNTNKVKFNGTQMTNATGNLTIKDAFLNNRCSVITGGSGLCDGIDDTGAGGAQKIKFNHTQLMNDTGNWSLKTGYLNTFVQAVAVGGEVSGTVGSITLGNDALDDQYYDSESDLTTLLNDNYQAQNTNKVKFNGTQMTNATGNLTIKLPWMVTYFNTLYQPLESTLTDIADGTIAEDLVNTAFPWANNEVADDITAGNVEGTDYGTMTDTYICIYDLAGTEVDCNTAQSTFESSTSNNIDPDRLTGDTTDNDLLDDAAVSNTLTCSVLTDDNTYAKVTGETFTGQINAPRVNVTVNLTIKLESSIILNGSSKTENIWMNTSGCVVIRGGSGAKINVC